MFSMNQRLTVVLIAAFLAAINVAHAEKCEGTAVRKYENLDTLHKNKDGSFVVQLDSTGVSSQTRPSNVDVWQHCSGLWTVNADKSGSGFGSCYSLDKTNGDYFLTMWEGRNAAGKGVTGKWNRIAGSGVYEATRGSGGSWSSGGQFPDGFRITRWQGDCVK